MDIPRNSKKHEDMSTGNCTDTKSVDRQDLPTKPESTRLSITTSRPKSLFSNGLWSVTTTIWRTGVTFFMTPFLLAMIGTEHYGLFVLVMSISGMMSVMNLGLGEATLRFVAYHYGRGDIKGINRVVGATLSVYWVMGLTAWVTMFFGAESIAGLLQLSDADFLLAVRLLRLTAFSFSLSFISGALGTIPQALQRYDISTKVQIIQSIVQTIGVVLLLVTGYGIYHIVLWSIVTSIVILCVNTVIAKRLLRDVRLFQMPTKAGLREVFGYGVFSGATVVLARIWEHFDRVLLGALLGPSFVAYLSVPQQLCFRGVQVSASASAGLVPRLSTASDDIAEVARVFQRSTFILLCCTVIIFVPITVLLPDFLRLWVGRDFAERSAWVGQLIAVGCIARGGFHSYQAVWKALGKPQYLTIQAVFSVLVGGTVNIVLISQFGFKGAGYAYIATTVVGLVSIVITWRYVLHARSWAGLLAPIGGSALISCVAMLGFFTFHYYCPTPNWTGVVWQGVVFAIVTFLGLWIWDRCVNARYLGGSVLTEMVAVVKCRVCCRNSG